jgi:hypothetical protein
MVKKSYRTKKAAPDELVTTGWDGSKATNQPSHAKCQHETHDDADAAEPHHWREVLLPRIGLISQTQTQPDLTHLRHDCRSKQASPGKGGQRRHQRAGVHMD